MRDSKVCLNGYWDFLPGYGHQSLHEILKDGEWISEKYLVPSSWSCNGGIFDIFEYPEEWNKASKGALRKVVDIHYESGTRVFLRLDAVGKQAHIFANGTEVGYTDDMFLPVEAELTSLLTPGENRMDLVVYCEGFPAVTRSDGEKKVLVPSGTWYANATMGIWQDAWLVTRPQVFLQDPFVLTHYREKTISFTVERNGEAAGVVIGEVLDMDGNIVLTLAEKETVTWEDARLWMPDDPYLYTLRMKLLIGKEVKDELCQRFGFREIWNEKHALYLNGVRIHLRGDAWHYQGLAMQNREYADNWCRFAKEQGINYIRPHGFPYPQCFYDVADESGMLIMAESAIYGSGKAMQADDPRYIEACRKHLVRFTREYRNHPSVFCWSMQNEMRWVDGREGYKQAIPMLMDVMAKEDSSGRLVSCDGDNRLLTDEMMQAVSMHYNIDGRISGWDKEKPLFFGEQGAYHYVSPQNACAFRGEDAYTSFWNAMEGLSQREAQFLNYARREEVTGITPFNYCNYMNKTIPFEDIRLEQKDVTAPGCHPSVIRAYSLTLNNGLMKGYPAYIPQPALRTLKQATAQVAVLPKEMDTRFMSGRTITRSFCVYNDTYHDETTVLTCIAEMDNGTVLMAVEETYEALAGSKRQVTYTLSLPETRGKCELTLRFMLRHGEKVVLEDCFTYEVHPETICHLPDSKIVCLGRKGSIPVPVDGTVVYTGRPEELTDIETDILIIGEDSPYSQEELQPILEKLTLERKVKGILILKQSEFVPGQLRLSGKPFFAAYPTGEHPVLKGLSSEDLRFWSQVNVEETEENWMVDNGFELPAEPGYRVILECGWGDWGWGGMNWCAMVEGRTHGVPVLLTQLKLEQFATAHPAAQILYRNCLEYLAASQAQCEEPILCSMEELGEKEIRELEQGRTIIVTGAEPKHSALLSEVLKSQVRVTEDPVYQLKREEHPWMAGVSDAQLTGLDAVQYSSQALTNEPAALYRIETENVTWLLSSVEAPWKGLFVDGMCAEPVKVSYATSHSNTFREPRCYGFTANVGKGRLAVIQLRQDGKEKFVRCLETIAMNAGMISETNMFTKLKEQMRYSIPEFMWLPVEKHWNYEEAVMYHADKAFLLNNLGEGSYGWMQRISAAEGTALLQGSGGKGVFVTVFMDCALNHDPEKRDPGELPDPSMVPDMSVKCNRKFNVYVNGRKFEGFKTSPDGTEEILITDVLLEKGNNRIFFEIFPGDREIELGAVLRDKNGTYLTDAVYRLTLD